MFTVIGQMQALIQLKTVVIRQNIAISRLNTIVIRLMFIVIGQKLGKA
ncbi:MAG: hypothetical protein V2A54_07775 [Bacteroidota bacterium]